ncbi:MAG TPA: ABC transporter substrate-binding protein, partial [Arthrobacter bacterium]|nr:ABC transporter substrate-binding protein [Arthrobacter sp.]
MRTRYALPVLTIATALALSGCVDNSQPAASGTAAASGDTAVVVQKNDSIAAMLPDKIKTAGVLNLSLI